MWATPPDKTGFERFSREFPGLTGFRGHSILIEGMEEASVLGYTLWLIQTLICYQKIDEQPCGQCNGCKSLVEPDGLHFLPVFPRGHTIRVQDVRAMLTRMREVRLESYQRQVLLILDMGSLNSAAANTLLKALEEPPENRYFVLCNPGSYPVLPTIRSRCQNVILPSLQKAFLDQSPRTKAVGRMSGWHPHALMESAIEGLEASLPEIWLEQAELYRQFGLQGASETGERFDVAEKILKQLEQHYADARLNMRYWLGRHFSALEWLRQILLAGMAGSRSYALELEAGFKAMQKQLETALTLAASHLREARTSGFEHWLLGRLKQKSNGFDLSAQVITDLRRMEQDRMLVAIMGVLRDLCLPDAEGALSVQEREVLELMGHPLGASDLAIFSERLVTARSMLYNQLSLEQVLEYLAAWLRGRLT